MSYSVFDPQKTYEGGLLVIGAGLPRTGTTSMMEALRILYGAPGYHMYEVFKKKTSGFWIEMEKGTLSNDEIRTHFDEYAHS
jgi:hypothetical protein